jgi:hypothetical protein
MFFFNRLHTTRHYSIVYQRVKHAVLVVTDTACSATAFRDMAIVGTQGAKHPPIWLYPIKAGFMQFIHVSIKSIGLVDVTQVVLCRAVYYALRKSDLDGEKTGRAMEPHLLRPFLP